MQQGPFVRKSAAHFLGKPTQENMQAFSKLITKEIKFFPETKADIIKKSIGLFLMDPTQENAKTLQSILVNMDSKLFTVQNIDVRLIDALMKAALDEHLPQLMLSTYELNEFKKQLDALLKLSSENTAAARNVIKISQMIGKTNPRILEPKALNSARFVFSTSKSPNKDPSLVVKQILQGRSDKAPLALKDYQNIAFTLAGLLPPDKIFQTIAEYQNEIADEYDFAKYLNNVELLIRELILSDPFHEKFKTLFDFMSDNPDMNKQAMRNHPDKLIREFYKIISNLNDEQAHQINATAWGATRSDTIIALGYPMSRREFDMKAVGTALSQPSQLAFSQYLLQSLAHPSPDRKEMALLAEKVAKDLHLYDMSLMLKLKPSEFHGLAWTKENKHMSSPNVMEISHNFNALASKVKQDLLLAKSLKHQRNILSFYLLVFEQCLALGNYNAAKAISSTLDGEAIHRLKYLFDLKGNDKKIYESLCDFSNIEGNSRNLRELIEREKETPVIPYLGLFLSDLMFFDEGNQDLLARSLGQGTVIKKMNDLQDKATSYWSKNQNMKPVTDMVALYHTQGNKLTDKESYDLSLQIKPRNPKDGEPYTEKEALSLMQEKLATKVYLPAQRKPVTTAFNTSHLVKSSSELNKKLEDVSVIKPRGKK